MEFISREEAALLNHDLLSNQAAIDLGRRLGYSGGANADEVQQLKQELRNHRQQLAVQTQRWKVATRGPVDERFLGTSRQIVVGVPRLHACWQRRHRRQRRSVPLRLHYVSRGHNNLGY
jgi:hypothetical protein